MPVLIKIIEEEHRRLVEAVPADTHPNKSPHTEKNARKMRGRVVEAGVTEHLGHWFSMMNLPDLMQKRFRIWLTQGFMIRWKTCKLQLQMERFGVLILIQG